MTGRGFLVSEDRLEERIELFTRCPPVGGRKPRSVSFVQNFEKFDEEVLFGVVVVMNGCLTPVCLVRDVFESEVGVPVLAERPVRRLKNFSGCIIVAATLTY
ncbi:hypothetical protein JCM17092_26150 [Haloplanus litoreus]